ncbi:MAG TPA: hypothetical protein VLA82_13280 [Actinomycetota bacterium]|nr:hypothetical protein [Actinomycetota bacterium]
MRFGKMTQDDAARRNWIVANVAAESRAHLANQDGLGEQRRARAITFIDAGYNLQLLSEEEARRLQRLLLTRETDDRVYLRCLDNTP